MTAQRIWILGGGLIGAGWAAIWAAAGHHVTVIDPDPGHLAAHWPSALAGVALPPVVPDAAQAGPAPDWVQENLPEDLDLKQTVLANIEGLLTHDTIIASSTSGFSPDQIAQGLAHQERVVIAHPCNPSWLMPVVELCGHTSTPPALLDHATFLLEGLGKTVLRLNRSLPGHLVNRLQAALWREAVHLLREDVASLGDIERAVTLGLGPRWSLIGPTTVFHVSGGEGGIGRFLDALGPQFDRLFDSLGSPVLDAETRQILTEAVHRADPRPVAEIAAARDATLIRLMAHLGHIGPQA